MNEKRKKIYSITIAILLILSIATSFIPSLEVEASQSYYLKDTTLWKYLPSGDELYNLGVYNEGILNSNLGDEILKGCNISRLLNTEDVNSYSTRYEQFKNMLNDTTQSYSGFIGGYSLEQITIDVDSYPSLQWFRDFLTDDTGYNVYLSVNESDTGFQLDYYICSESLENHCFSCNGGGYLYSLSNTNVYLFSINLIANNFYNNPNVQVNTVNISNDRISPTGFILYTDFPLYFPWSDGYGTTYQSIDGASAIRTMLSNGETSDFLVDRRTLMSNYSGGFTVDNDPISQEYKGAWDIDLVPVDDLLDGSIKVKFIPTEKLSSENPNYSVNYYFGFFFNGKNFNYNSLVDRPLMNLGMSNVIFGNSDTSFKSITLNSYYNITDTDGISVNSISNDYVSFPTSTVLRGLTPVGSYTLQGALVGGNLGQNSNPINVYQSLAFYKHQNMFNQNNGGNNIGGAFGPVSVGLSSNQGGITSAKLIVQAQAFYNGNEASNVATVTYNYLTGEVTKQGTVSTGNDTAVDSATGVPEGLTPSEQEAIQNSTQNIVTNGGNTNNNTNNPTFTNNNNPTITINNSNGGIPGNEPENPSEGSVTSMLGPIWSIWSTWKFLETISQTVADNEFLSFLFSSEIWQVPLFNIILPALAVMVFVSIASTVVRFIRGQ